MRVSLPVIDAFLRKVHGGFDTMSSVEQGIWREILSQINAATVEGLLQSPHFAPSSEPSEKSGQSEPSKKSRTLPRQEAFLSALRHSNEVFAAFKVHALQQEVAAKLLTPDGQLKTFAQFRRDVEGIVSHQCRAWLQTEYDTAVIRAHNAADWQVFEANRDIMPNLRWLPTTSAEPEVNHRAYWLMKLNLPIDDPFWRNHHPGDHWNCKCSLEQNSDPVVRPSGPSGPSRKSEKSEKSKPSEKSEPSELSSPQPGLDNNPGIDHHTFSDSHPYFPQSCGKCPFYKPGLKNTVQTLFKNRKKDCYNCPFIDGCISRDKEKRNISDAASARKKEVKDNGLMPVSGKEECSSVQSGMLNRTGKVRTALLKHCHHDYDVEAAVFIWNNPQNMQFVKSEALGEGKDMSKKKNQDNIRKKKEVLHFVCFNVYEFKFGNREFYVKLALCQKNYEQFYALAEK